MSKYKVELNMYIDTDSCDIAEKLLKRVLPNAEVCYIQQLDYNCTLSEQEDKK